MNYKEELEKIAAQQRKKVLSEELERIREAQERQRADRRADEILARIKRDKASMMAFIKESRIVELLRQAGQILHKYQRTEVSFHITEVKKSDTFIPKRDIVVENMIWRNWIIDGSILSAEMHHAEIGLMLDSVYVEGGGISGEGTSSSGHYSPSGIEFYMDRKGDFYRPGALNIFNRVATRSQWQRSSNPLERAIKNELSVYFQRQ